MLSPILFAILIDDIGKIQNNRYGTCIILYADDILLIAKSVTALQRMLWLCEQELNSIDMVINVRKSCCMRVGTRQDKPCSNINTIDGRQLSLVNEIRYLGVVIVRSVKFKCSAIKPRNLFIVRQIVSLRKSADWLHRKLLLNSRNVNVCLFCYIR